MSRAAGSTAPAGIGRDGRQGSRPYVGLLIFCLLLSVELFLFSGRFHSLDEMALVATTESVVKWQRSDINSLAWAQWFLPGPDQPGMFNAQGSLYAKKAPLVSWLDIPLYAAAGLVHARQVQASLLLNALVVAATAGALFRFARRLGYDAATASAGGLLFGLGTNALVYSRYLFSEPLGGLGLLLAVEGVWRYRRGEPGPRSALIQGGGGLAIAVLSNVANLAFVPLFVVFLFLTSEKARAGSLAPWKARARPAAVMLVPVALATLAWGFWNVAHFGSPLVSGYHWKMGEGFSAPIWITVPALLASPARGLLFFVPASLLSVAGAASFLRRDRGLGWLCSAVIGAHFFLFGAWWMWWGGWSWGPRFLVPVAPLLILLALPVLRSWRTLRAGPRLAVVGIGALSFAVQLLGATVGFDEFELRLSTTHLAPAPVRAVYPYGWDGLWNPQYSPIWGHAKLLASGLSDLVWRPAGGCDWLLVLALVAWMAFCGWGLRAVLHGKRPAASRPAAVLVVGALMLGLFFWRAGQHPLSASYGMDPTAGSAAMQAVAQELQPGDGVMAVRSLSAAEMDGIVRFAPCYGIPDGGLTGAQWTPDLDRLIANAMGRHRRLWLIVRSERDPFAARIAAKVAAEMRGSAWSPVGGYQIAVFAR